MPAFHKTIKTNPNASNEELYAMILEGKCLINFANVKADEKNVIKPYQRE